MKATPRYAVAAVALLCAIALVAAFPAGAASPLRPAGSTPAAGPAATVGEAGAPQRIVARASAECALGIVYDDGEANDAIRFLDNNDDGVAVDALMRFDLGSTGTAIDQMCICWNRTGGGTGGNFDHEILFYTVAGNGQPGTPIAVAPATAVAPPPALETVFLSYDLSSLNLVAPGDRIYAGVSWNGGDLGDPGLVLCIDQNGPGNQPMWVSAAAADQWSSTDDLFGGTSVPPPTALMVRLGTEDDAPSTCPQVPCVEDATSLCLNDDRFQVSADWTIFQNGEFSTGPAMAGDPLTGDTGYFWFFNDRNVEMVVKVLDACSFADRFWVFAGGLTNVEVEMRVCDTQEGVLKTYRNPLNTPFQPIQDTNAFATCP